MHVLFVLVYVDDIIVTKSNTDLITEFISTLGQHFPVKDLGQLHFFFLGIEVHQNSHCLYLNQAKYIFDLLHRTNMHDAKTISTPMPTSTKLTAFDGTSFEDPQLYHSVVGMQYLAFTHRDIFYSINKVCQFMHCPKNTHWQAVKHILRY